MEVVSIADYERDRAHELDTFMHSAVDQLVALTQPSPSPLSEVIHQFGKFQLDEDGYPQQFDFSPPTTCSTWPGPHFGSHSLHKVIAKAPTKHRSRVQERHRKLSGGQPPRAQTMPIKPLVRSHHQTSSTPASSVCAPSTSRPFLLLNLPAEIRNAIWSILAIRSDSVEVQLRQIQHLKRLHGHHGKVVRRFPLEPPVAHTNKQVRREVLSIFYGSNKFILEKNACKMFAEYGMLNPANMQLWKPNAELAAFLTRVDIQFNALPRTTPDMAQIKYCLRKAVDTQATVFVKVHKTNSSTSKKTRPVEVEQFCLCAELDIIAEANGSTAAERGGNLIDLAVHLVRKRHEKMFSRPDIKNTARFYPAMETCARCEKETFDIVFSGM